MTEECVLSLGLACVVYSCAAVHKNPVARPKLRPRASFIFTDPRRDNVRVSFMSHSVAATDMRHGRSDAHGDCCCPDSYRKRRMLQRASSPMFQATFWGVSTRNGHARLAAPVGLVERKRRPRCAGRRRANGTLRLHGIREGCRPESCWIRQQTCHPGLED